MSDETSTPEVVIDWLIGSFEIMHLMGGIPFSRDEDGHLDDPDGYAVWISALYRVETLSQSVGVDSTALARLLWQFWDDPKRTIEEAILSLEGLKRRLADDAGAQNRGPDLPPVAAGFLALRLDQGRRVVTRDGFEPLDVSHSPLRFAMLNQLVKSKEAYCSRDVLRDVWSDELDLTDPEDSRIDKEISNLRCELKGLGLTIRNNRKVGWRIVVLSDSLPAATTAAPIGAKQRKKRKKLPTGKNGRR